MDSETGVQFLEKMMPCYMLHVTLSSRLEWMHEWHEKIVVGRTSFSGLEGHVCLSICVSMFLDRKADEEKEMSKCDPLFPFDSRIHISLNHHPDVVSRNLKETERWCPSKEGNPLLSFFPSGS